MAIISSYHWMNIHTLSFTRFVLTCTVWHFADPQSWVVSHLLTQFLHSPIHNCICSWIPLECRERCDGVFMLGTMPSSYIVSPQQPPSSASLSSFIGYVQVLLRLYSTTICSPIECMYMYRETIKMHARSWCSVSCDCTKDKMCCGYVKTTAVRIRHQVSLSAAQVSWWLSMSPTALGSSLSCSWCFPQICVEVIGTQKFYYPIS